MPRSRRFRKGQSQVKPEWGKNNPKAKARKRKAVIVVGIIAVAAVLVAVLLVVSPSLFLNPFGNSSPSPSSTPFPIPSASPLTSPSGEYSASGTRILLETSMGNIIVQMRDDKPITTQNFVTLVKQGFYDSTVFHRMVAGFIIQGGENVTFNADSISDEILNDNHNFNGTIAMAKTSQPNSAASQFFINVANNNSTTFDSTYSVFGQVIAGMDVVMQISNVPVTANPQTGENSQPVQVVTLIHAEVLP